MLLFFETLSEEWNNCYLKGMHSLVAKVLKLKKMLKFGKCVEWPSSIFYIEVRFSGLSVLANYKALVLKINEYMIEIHQGKAIDG